jgi:hypothetical protein
MPVGASKTALRSIRIPRDLLETITQDAETRGLSVNALVSSILTRYAEWDRFAEKFGLVTITRAGYLAMLEAIPEEKLVDYARRVGAQNPRDMTLFWFKRLGLDPFLSYLTLIARYGGMIEYEVDRQGPEVILLVHHHMGKAQSRFLIHFLSEAIHSVVGVVPRCQMGETSLVLKFRAPSVPPTTAV